MPVDPKRVQAIFLEAVDRADPADRAAFLDRECTVDPELRQRIEALLRAHDQPDSYLDRPIVRPEGPVTLTQADPLDRGSSVAPTGSDEAFDREFLDFSTLPGSNDSRPIAEGPGTVIGPYKLLQRIGEGGMGAVFMAEQERPVRRKVALKVIKPGMDTNQVVARFEAERQALAMMDHPNIARVLDVGTTDTGRPYFVMELVKGVSITEYCDVNGLSPRERLELFIPVCQAIQHAHQKGIIHRDIKPSNVLVTLHDGVPVPKVIDFGVAKAIDQRLTERTLFTEFGAVIGTLEYMSPEQAEMGGLDIDTRSDIYSLGVLLYELLTGSTPLERGKLRKAAFAEILRRIREEEPTKPSTRLGESADALPSISAQRRTEPTRLARLVRGDLDWIVMKSLEKDRTRRYETANGLAKDIRRHLDGDAVEACPPSATYRLRKFARRHSAALATAGTFALLLVAATALSLGLAFWADRERVRAVRAERAAIEQQGRARDREQMAIDAVKRFGEVIRDTPELKNTPSLQKLRATLLKEPQAFFKLLRDRLQADRETTPDSLARLAAANYALGQLTVEIGDKRDALRVYEETLAIRERLVRENPTDARFRLELAICVANIGGLQNETGRPAEALASAGRAHAIFERLARENPSETEFQNELAWSHHTIGDLMKRAGRSAEGMAAYERAGAIRERLAREHPESPDFRHGLGANYLDTGHMKLEAGRPAEALAAFEQACAIFEGLVQENPSATGRQLHVARARNTIAYLHNVAGRPAEEIAAYELACTSYERLVRENPSVPQFALELGGNYHNIGRRQQAMARPAEARAAYERALTIRARLARDHPESAEYAGELGGTWNDLALIDLEQGRFEDAWFKIKRAIEWQRKALASDPNHPRYRRYLVIQLTNLIRAAEGLGHADEAAEARRERNVLRNSDPSIVALFARLAGVLKGQEMPKDDAERIRLAYGAYEKERYSASTRLFTEAIANDPKLGDGRQAQHRYNAACAAALAASARGKDEPPPDDAARIKLRRQAREWLRAELEAWTKILDDGPAEMKARIEPTLRHWKADTDLAGIREAKELADLPDEERAALKVLWSDVDQLATKAAGTPETLPRK